MQLECKHVCSSVTCEELAPPTIQRKVLCHREDCTVKDFNHSGPWEVKYHTEKQLFFCQKGGHLAKCYARHNLIKIHSLCSQDLAPSAPQVLSHFVLATICLILNLEQGVLPNSNEPSIEWILEFVCEPTALSLQANSRSISTNHIRYTEYFKVHLIIKIQRPTP